MCVDAHSFARGALIGVVLALAPGALTAQQNEHIFEPGKKHICVPAADRRSWNCGSAEDPPVATPKPDGPTLRSARAADLDESERAAAAAAAEAPAASDPPASVAAPASSSRSVPSYLLSPEAASAPVASSAPVEAKPAETRPAETKTADVPAPAAPVAEPVAAAPAAAAPAPNPEPAAVITDAKPPALEPAPEQVVTQAKPAAPEPPTTISKPAAASPPPTIAAPPEPVVAAPRPAVVETPSERVAESKSVPAEPAPIEPAPAQAAPAPPAATPAEPVAQRQVEPPRAAALRTPDAFRTLADARYVLELARGSDRAAVEAEAAQVPLTHGDVYLLPLQRDGASWYVAVWGDFDSIDSARAARSEALAAGNAGVGWPRRVGPLKQELRLVR